MSEQKQFDDLDMTLEKPRLKRQQRYEARYVVSTTAPVPCFQQAWGTLDLPDDEPVPMSPQIGTSEE